MRPEQSRIPVSWLGLIALPTPVLATAREMVQQQSRISR
jgi:hypothetical protein